MVKTLKWFGSIALALMVLGGVFAQEMMSPMVEVRDQVVTQGMVRIGRVYNDGPAFVVIHTQQDGSVGPVIGWRSVNSGMSMNVDVPIDVAAATGTLYAMLHADTGEVGVYEFGTVAGADAPVSGDMEKVNPAFKIELIQAYDQFVTENTFTVAAVVTQQDGFIVIHSGDQQKPGPVLGYAPVTAGANSAITVELSGEIGDFVWPMLHVDTGAAGTYEFGTVEGADGPVVIDNRVAMMPVVVGGPSMRVMNQLVDDSVTALSVLSAGAGFLVIHADNNGAPGEVIGFAPVADGVNMNVTVEVDAAKVTPILFPMLHSDTGVAGTYEFGEVDGADTPQMGINDKPLFFPILARAGIEYRGELMPDNIIMVHNVLSAAQGFLVIHADDGGKPGKVLGFSPVVAGANSHVLVKLNEAPTATVFPMLHEDTGVVGVYEFGEVEGEDKPVQVNGQAVFGPMTPEVKMPQ
jgi:hypothetical protein